MTVLLVSATVPPAMNSPPPAMVLLMSPPWIATPVMATVAPAFTVTTVPLWLPSMTVLLAPAPARVRLVEMLTVSVYVPAATLIVSPGKAALTASWMCAYPQEGGPLGQTESVAACAGRTAGAALAAGNKHSTSATTTLYRSQLRCTSRTRVRSIVPARRASKSRIRQTVQRTEASFTCARTYRGVGTTLTPRPNILSRHRIGETPT